MQIASQPLTDQRAAKRMPYGLRKRATGKGHEMPLGKGTSTHRGRSAKSLSRRRFLAASDTKSTTVIAFHAPVFETTWRSEDREALPFPGSMYLKESAEMKALFARHPNVRLYVHGHLHHAYGVRDDFGRGEYCLDGRVLHISVGATANNRGSSVLWIGRDKIVAKVRDHANRRWRDEFEFTLPAETTLESAPERSQP